MSELKEIFEKYPERNFLQSEDWRKANELMGNHAILTKIENCGIMVGIVKDARRGRYLEIPAGPLINWKSKKEREAAKKEILKIAKENHCVFARFRPQIKNTPENLALLKDLGAKKAPMHLAAEHTVMLDLEKDEDTLLSEMRRQTRYEVRRAKKLNIAVESSNSEEIFRKFREVQAKTAARQNFFPPNLKTLLAEREAFGKKAKIYVAKTETGEPIAYGLILIGDVEAAYYEAASTDLNRKLPGAYALLWQVTLDLKKLGLKRFNLFGIAPKNSPNHRYAGVTTFKTGFGGEIVEFVPAHDFILNKFRYLPNLIIELVRKKRRHL